MSSHAKTLAEEFEAANDALLRLLEHATPEQWRMRTLDDGELRAVGVIAHHVAEAHLRIARRVDAFARGEPVPARRPELFDARNAQEARDNPEPDQRSTLDRLRRNGATVAALIAGLTDAQLARTGTEDAGAEVLSTAQVIELRQIGHVRSHLETIGTVLG
jgi:hypothetical protein